MNTKYLQLLLLISFYIPNGYSQSITGPSGETILTFGTINQAIPSPDGNSIFTIGSMGLYQWDSQTGNIIKSFGEFGTSQPGFYAIALTPDGTKLISTDQDHVTIWEVASGDQIQTLDVRVSDAPIVISPNGKMALLRIYNQNTKQSNTELWNLESNQRMYVFEGYNGNEGYSNFSAFTPDSESVFVTYLIDFPSFIEMELWSINTQNQTQTYPLDVGVSETVLFPDGNTLLTKNTNNTITKWNAASSDRIFTFAANGRVLDFTQNEILLYQNPSFGDIENMRINRYSIDTGELIQSIDTMLPAATLNNINDSNQYFYHEISGEFGLLDSITFKKTYSNQQYIDYVYTATFSPDGNTVCIGNDFRAHIIHADTGKNIHILPTQKYSVFNIKYSNNGLYLVTVTDQNTVQAWNTQTGELLNTIQAPTQTSPDYDLSIDIANDGSRLITSGDRTRNEIAIVWNVQTGEKLFVLSDSYESLQPPFQKSVHPFYGPSRHSRIAQFTPDNNYIITSGRNGNEIVMWNAQTGNYEKTLFETEFSIEQIKISSDTKYIVSLEVDKNNQTNRNIIIWDFETGEELVQFKVPNDYLINYISLSPDHRYLLTASGDAGTGDTIPFYLWDTFSGELLSTFQGNHKNQVVAAEFSPDGQSILTAATDSTVRIWKLNDLLPQSQIEDYKLY